MGDPSSVRANNPAEVYEDFYVPCIYRYWTGELLDRAGPEPGERILDVACGTGVVARTISNRLRGNVQASGIDLNPSMLEVARMASAREGVEVEFIEGSADDLPFPDDSFDLVLVQQGLQFFGDKMRAAREMHRVLVPGGRAVSSTWTGMDNNPFNKVFALEIRHHLGITEPPLAFGFGDADVLMSLFLGAGFSEVVVEAVDGVAKYPSPDQFVDLGIASASAAVPELRDMDAIDRAGLTDAIRDAMAAPIQKYTIDGVLVAPMQAQIVVACKEA